MFFIVLVLLFLDLEYEYMNECVFLFNYYLQGIYLKFSTSLLVRTILISRKFWFIIF